MRNTKRKMRAEDEVIYEEMSRRAFLRNSGLIAGGVGAMAMLGGCAPTAQGESSDKTSDTTERTTDELPIVEAKKPEKTEFEVDVLVVGGGFAGVSAATRCKENGKSVLLVDKGSPGYSGYMPWPHTFRWFDADLGDDREACKEAMKVNSEYTCNQNWYDIWMDESKAVKELFEEWGFLERWKEPDFQNEDQNDAKMKSPDQDRHSIWHGVLNKSDIDYIDHTMIIDVIEEDGSILGAVGIHVPSGAVVTVKAKATLLCTGAGSYKPTGFPTGSCTFDGEAIGYRHGLQIAGKEYSDFHGTSSFEAGNVFLTWGWQYMENLALCGGTPMHENLALMNVAAIQMGVAPATIETSSAPVPPGFGGGPMQGLSESDPRVGAITSIPMGPQNAGGGAVGMGIHKSEGIFCGNDALDGTTELSGLFVAGDTEASMVCGAMYCGGFGFSSGMSAIQGLRAASAACDYVDTAQAPKPSESTLSSIIEYVEGPSKLEAGFDPNWARDVLHSIMAPYWVNCTKSEATLMGALVNVEFLRDNVIPRLHAETSHELRLCHEMRNKVLSAEMKLRAGLERKESRGLHYRIDYPFRDDANFLCYIGLRKGADEQMELSRIEYDDAWKGDQKLEYQARYVDRFPGEIEALGLDPSKELTAQGYEFKGDEGMEVAK